MPIISTMGGTLGWGKQTVATDSPIVAGNATTSMNATGATVIPGVAGQDDTFGPMPTDSSIPFFFFGTNYGSGAAAPNGIYWNTNNVIGFGQGIGTIQWLANTGRGILLGNFDRRTNTAYYFPITTSGNYKILRILVLFQNIYNVGPADAGQMAIRMCRNIATGNQYVEFRIFKGSGGANGGGITTAGYGTAVNKNWNITNGTSFQNTFGETFSSTFPTDNTSFVISSDPNGNTWTFTNTSYLNI